MFKFIEILKNYEKEMERLNKICAEQYKEKEIFRIKNLEGISLIYNPLGDDLIVETNKNTMYIQGKPKNIVATLFTEIIILNQEYLDKQWFDILIKPLKIDEKIEYKYIISQKEEMENNS